MCQVFHLYDPTIWFWYNMSELLKEDTNGCALPCRRLLNSQCTHSHGKIWLPPPPQKGDGIICILKNKQKGPCVLGLTRFKSKRQRKKKYRKVQLGALESSCSLGCRHRDSYHNALIWTRYRQTTQSNQILKAQRTCSEEHPVLLKRGSEFCDSDRGVGESTGYHSLSLQILFVCLKNKSSLPKKCNQSQCLRSLPLKLKSEKLLPCYKYTIFTAHEKT